MPAARLLIVDDEIESAGTDEELPGYMAYYIQALDESGFDVVSVDGPDGALAILDGGDVDIVVLDVMMPPGESLKDADTAEGLKTGLVLAGRIHESNPQIPIVILSNAVPREESPTKNRFDELLENEVVTRVYFKPDFTPRQVAEELNIMWANR